MITRLVEMELRPEAVAEFMALYGAARATIAGQPGCRSVVLVQAADASTRFATWSVWDDEAALEGYRTSAFFRSFWPRVRALFAQPARAQTFRPVELG